MEGIPLHAWSEKVIRCLGECFGQVMEVKDKSVSQRRVDRACVKVLCDSQRMLPRIVALEVEGVQFPVMVRFKEAEDQRFTSPAKIGGRPGGVSPEIAADSNVPPSSENRGEILGFPSNALNFGDHCQITKMMDRDPRETNQFRLLDA